MTKIMWKLILAFFFAGFAGLMIGVFNIGGVPIQAGLKVFFAGLGLAVMCFGVAACTGSNKKLVG